VVIKQTRQSHSKYNFVQYVFFSKKRYIRCTMMPVAKPTEAGEFSRIFCVKSNLRECKITFSL